MGGLVARAGRLWRWSGLGGGGVCVCACFRGRVVGSTGGSWGSSGRAGASGLARPDPAAPQPSHAGGQPPGSCCLVDRSSRGSLVLSRRPPCHAGCGLCPRAALPFRIRTNRVLCQGAQRAPARGSPVFCWAGEGVFHSPVVSINDLVFLWWCSVFWPSPSPHRSSVCKSVVCHENDRAAQRVPVSFPFHLPAGPCQLPGGLPPLPTPPALLPDSSSLAEGPRASQPLWAPAPCTAPRGSCPQWVCLAEPHRQLPLQHPRTLQPPPGSSRDGVPWRGGGGGCPMAHQSPSGVVGTWLGMGRGTGVDPGCCRRGRKMRRCPGVIQTDFNAVSQGSRGHSCHGWCQRRLHRHPLPGNELASLASLGAGRAGGCRGGGCRGSGCLPVPGRSVFPERGPQHGLAVSPQGASWVPAQVPAVLPFDGHASPLPELEEEILREFPIAAHRPAARHVPELAPLACGESPGAVSGVWLDSTPVAPHPITHLGSGRHRH